MLRYDPILKNGGHKYSGQHLVNILAKDHEQLAALKWLLDTNKDIQEALSI